jgi:hypothetical protein
MTPGDTVFPMTKVFRTRYFTRWMRKAGLTDRALREAVREMEQGLVDADLGGGVVKKRVAFPGRGKRGSARTLVATNRRDRWFFIFGYAKNRRDNVDEGELSALQEIAADLLALTPADLANRERSRALEEVDDDEQE